MKEHRRLRRFGPFIAPHEIGALGGLRCACDWSELSMNLHGKVTEKFFSLTETGPT